MSTKQTGELIPALARALELGASVRGTTSPNPPVGAVILDTFGRIVGEGATQPVGGAHAEVIALREAGAQAAGGTAVVTLEPCNHTGKTGPCTKALIDAQIARVVFIHADPNPLAAGGAQMLRSAGIETVCASDWAIESPYPDALIPWLRAVEMQRPHVTVKFAQTLDGFIAAADGTSQWITGEEARAHVHVDRTLRDAIVVGTGTALADNPRLTARDEQGNDMDRQPRRVVIGSREIPTESNLNKSGFTQFASITEALSMLWEEGVRDVLVEGGAGLSSAMFNAGVVDAIQVYLAPKLLGEGQKVLAHPLAHTLSQAPSFRRTHVETLGNDILLEYVGH